MVYDPRFAVKCPVVKIGERLHLDKAIPCEACGKPSHTQVVVEVDTSGHPEIMWCLQCYENYKDEQGI